MMGIDFESIIKDRNILEKRFEIMKGYWEIFNYSISETSKKSIIYSMIELTSLNENGYIECFEPYGNFNYRGYCFFVANITYFIMEEINLLNEMMFIVTNSPDRTVNPILNGVLLCLTGGSYELVSIPAATKIVLRHIGTSTDKVADKYGISKKLSIQEIIREVKIKINSDTTLLDQILPLIDNHIPQDAVPYALRAKLF